MLKPATKFGLHARLSVVLILLIGIITAVAILPGGGIFRDTQAALVVGVFLLFVAVASTGIPIRYNQAHLAMAGFAIISLAAVSTSVWRIASLQEVALLGAFLATMFLASNLAGEDRLRLAGFFLVIVGTTVAAAGLYRYFIGDAGQVESLIAMGHVEQARQLATMTGRAFGNFSSANSFAGFTALFIPICAGLILQEKDIRIKISLAAALAINLAALYFSFSKGAYLATGVAAGVMLFGAVALGRLNRRWLGLIIAAPAVPAIYIFWAFFNFSFVALASNIVGRVELWQVALRLWASAPILGVGPGAFGTQMTQYQIGPVFSQYAHNTYLQVAAESGTLGLLAMVAVIALVLVVAWRRLGAGGEAESWLRLGLIAGVASFAAHNIVDFTWYVPGVALAFWFLAGLAVSDHEKAPSEGAHPTLSRYLLVGAMVVMILPMVAVFAGTSMAVNAKSLSNQGVAEQADETYERALAFFPFNDEAIDELARSRYENYKKYKVQANNNQLELQGRAVALRPTWPFYHSRLADNLALFGKKVGAEKEYRKAVELYPNDPSLRVKLGGFLLDNGRHRDALKVYRAAAALGPMYGAKGKTAADIEVARADARGPLRSIGFAYMGMARVHVAQSRLAQGKRELDRAENLLGKSPGLLFVRGQIFEGEGRHSLAAGAYQEAVDALANVDPQFSFALASALAKTGQAKPARLELGRLIDADPGHLDAKRLLKRLE